MNPLKMKFQDEREKFEFFFLGGLLGIVFFNFFVLLNPTVPDHPKPDFLIYILAWSLCPLLGAAATAILHRVKKSTPEPKPAYYPCLVFINVLVLLPYLQPNWGLRFFGGNAWYFLLLFICLQAVVSVLFILAQTRRLLPAPVGEDPYHLYRWTLLVFVAWVLSFHSLEHMLQHWGFPNYLFLLGALCIFYFLVPFKADRSKGGADYRELGKLKVAKSLPLYAAVFLLITWLVVDPYFPYQRYHCSYYMGPLSDLIAGKSLLVDINAQYGVLVFYFLKFFFHFLPLGYTSFSWVLTFLIVAQYCVFYFIARQLFRSGVFSFLVLLALLLVNHFAQTPRPFIVPSVGPLRFGFIYILMASVLLRNQFPRWKGFFIWLEALLLGLAFFWSYEVCFYTLPPYLAFILFESGILEKGLGLDWRGLLKRLIPLSTCVFLVGAFLYGDIHARSGDWPHWNYYLDYIFLYKGGFGSMARPGFDTWCLLAGTLYFSMFALLYLAPQREKGKALPAHFNVLVLALFYGIFQFLYFVYRAHPNNLFHVSMPGLLLFAFWLQLLRSEEPSFLPRGVGKIIFAVSVVFIGVYSQALVPEAVLKIKEQSVPLAQWWPKVLEGARDIPRDDGFSREAEELFNKYSGNRKALTYFLGENELAGDDYRDYGLDVAIFAGRVKTYPYNDLSQANICPPVLARIKAFDPRLRAGDYVYYRPFAQTPEKNAIEENIKFEGEVMDGLFKKYNLKQVEEKYGIQVYQVKGTR